MGQLVLFMHTSLDGFVAGPKGEMDWIHVEDEIFDYVAHRINESDTAFYGRVTYQMMEAYWPTAGDLPGASKHDIEHSRWYKRVTKVVLSRTLNAENLVNTRIISGNLSTEINRLKKETAKEILIFGSPSAAHALMAEDLIDGFWLFVNPILLGEGIPLFKNVSSKKLLTLAASKTFSSGVICLHYTRNERK